MRNYLIDEINQNELISKKHKMICATLNYIEHFLVVAFTITGYVSISAFASLIGITMQTESSAIKINIAQKLQELKSKIQ